MSKPELILPKFVTTGSFYEIGGGRGETITVFLKKMRPPPMTLDEAQKINGVCTYKFVYSGSLIIGVVFTTPKAYTVNKGHSLCVGRSNSEEQFSPQTTLNPLGLLLMVGDGSSLVVTNIVANIPLVIKVDKK